MEQTYKLKVGDELYEHGDKNYYKVIVERITPKLAILSNGDRVFIEEGCYWGVKSFVKYGDKYKNYGLFTEEAQKDKDKMDRQRMIIRWFRDYSFSFSDKEKIYKMFNNEQLDTRTFR
jgi:hypothetical protein